MSTTCQPILPSYVLDGYIFFFGPHRNSPIVRMQTTVQEALAPPPESKSDLHHRVRLAKDAVNVLARLERLATLDDVSKQTTYRSLVSFWIHLEKESQKSVMDKCPTLAYLYEPQTPEEKAHKRETLQQLDQKDNPSRDDWIFVFQNCPESESSMKELLSSVSADRCIEAFYALFDSDPKKTKLFFKLFLELPISKQILIDYLDCPPGAAILYPTPFYAAVSKYPGLLAPLYRNLKDYFFLNFQTEVNPQFLQIYSHVDRVHWPENLVPWVDAFLELLSAEKTLYDLVTTKFFAGDRTLPQVLTNPGLYSLHNSSIRDIILAYQQSHKVPL